MKAIIFLISLIILNISFGIAQNNIIIQDAELVETIDNQYVSHIPMFVDTVNSNNKAVEKINEYLLETFMIDSFKQEEIGEFRWYDVNFQSEIKSDIAYIAFEGEYYGAYVSNVKDRLFFSLKTGELLDSREIPFQALFRIDSYHNFINEFWLKDVNTELLNATSCAGTEPSCSPYDINHGGYFENEPALEIKYSSNCFNHALQACAPIISKVISISELEPFLNSFANNLFKDSYFQTDQTEIDKYLYRISKQDSIPNNIFIFGKIDEEYPFSMAINLNKNSNKVSGYYYYDNNSAHEKITLNGEYNNKNINIKEMIDGEITGGFSFLWSTEYGSAHYPYLVSYINGKSLYLSGSWSNPDKSKVFNIEITALKMNNNPKF